MAPAMYSGASHAGLRVVYRGEIVDFAGTPGAGPGSAPCRHFPDGGLVIEGGRIVEAAPWEALSNRLGELPVSDLRGRLLMPGFIDSHIHYSQTDAIASPASGLLDWLERHTFAQERRFADPAHAAEVAGVFLDELLRYGTTTAMVWCTVHPASVDAIMQAARNRGMRLVAGKVLMDRNCPQDLQDTVASSVADSRALIERWHGQGRLGYALTPRFAPTSSPAQLAACARLLDEHPGVWLQSHLAENVEELRWVAELFPRARSYTDVYDRFGLLRERTVWAHGIHLDNSDRARLAAAGAAIAFCPTSNLFLGSGLFDAGAADRHGLRWMPATDVGGGTSFSMLRTLAAAHDVLRLQGQALSAVQAFRSATLGAAQALGLDDRIGSFKAGREADFVAFDLAATPLLARRTALAGSLEERLFALMTLGDDRAVSGVWIAGVPSRAAGASSLNAGSASASRRSGADTPG
jgi:guanine deaminase